MLTRRNLIGSVLGAVAFRNDTLNIVERLLKHSEPDPFASALDEDFWVQIQNAFTLDRNLVNFNNGGCCPSPRVVLEALERAQRLTNQAPSYYMWRQLEPEIENVRRRLASLFGCDAEEVAITRNASESLENLLFGLELKEGDEVLTTTLDYPRMITTLKQRERRNGIRLTQVDPPHVPKSARELVAAFEHAITRQTRMILMSQVSFMNGQIFPVRQVVELGKRLGIPVIVDGAHALAQFPFDNKELGCEFYGASLHKWLMAPVGTGFLYVKKAKIPAVWSMYASTQEQSADIRKFEEIGTHPAANHNAIAEALTFHELIGGERKAERLRALRRRWTDKMRDLKNVVFHTNLDPAHSCGLTTVEIKGIENDKLAGWLLDKHSIFVTGIGHPNFKGIRVSPNVYTTFGEIDRFAEAMTMAATKGIG